MVIHIIKLYCPAANLLMPNNSVCDYGKIVIICMLSYSMELHVVDSDN